MRLRFRLRPWLLMVAALSGPALRQAEAADDFARASANRPVASAEATDGGVGDDSGAATLEAPRSLEKGGVVASPCPDLWDAAVAPRDVTARHFRGLRDHARPPDPARVRRGRLQVLRE